MVSAGEDATRSVGCREPTAVVKVPGRADRAAWGRAGAAAAVHSVTAQPLTPHLGLPTPPPQPLVLGSFLQSGREMGHSSMPSFP